MEFRGKNIRQKPIFQTWLKENKQLFKPEPPLQWLLCDEDSKYFKRGVTE